MPRAVPLSIIRLLYQARLVLIGLTKHVDVHNIQHSRVVAYLRACHHRQLRVQQQALAHVGLALVEVDRA